MSPRTRRRKTDKLTDQQQEFALAAIELFSHTRPEGAAQFRVEGDRLVLPDCDALCQEFISHGVWAVELSLERTREQLGLSPGRYAAMQKSLRGLDNKIGFVILGI